MEEKCIEIDYKNQELKIIVKKKRMKSLRLKIDASGKIYLSIPISYPYYKAVEFVKSKWDWLIKHQTKILSNAHNFCSFTSNSKISIMGHERIVNVILSSRNEVDLDEINMTIYTKDTSPDYVKKVFYKWAKPYCYGHLLDLFEITYNSIFKKLKINKPQLIIKQMKTMWGNCRYGKEVITLNLYLLKTPVECINYVILHELAHMIYHDHGKEFKDFLTAYMPDWKNRKNKLNGYNLEF